ncbi:MAG: hypothetical protein U1F36_08360 [Planctomycetota bacterium]
MDIAPFDLLETHRHELSTQARLLLRARPDAEPVGLVVDSDVPEAAPIRAEIERVEGKPFLGGCV